MSDSSTTTVTTQAERLAERIRQHKEEVARLRAEIGDPAEALDEWVRRNFSLEALLPDGEHAVWELDDD